MKSRTAKISHRPKTHRWSVSFACNDPYSGTFVGRVDHIAVGIGRGNFTYGTDYPDIHDLDMHGDLIRFRWLSESRFQLGRHKYACAKQMDWVGNWCWDACFVDRHTARKLLYQLAGEGWYAESGSLRLVNWFDKLKELKESGK